MSQEVKIGRGETGVEECRAPQCGCCDGDEYLHKMLQEAIKKQPRAAELHAKLLMLGGTSALLYPAGSYIYELDKILDHGQVWDGRKYLLRRGRIGSCHENASRLWVACGGALKIATGYALSDDGMWVQHSWNVRPDGYVLESAVPRLKYYGIVPDEVDSLAFLLRNVFPTTLQEMAERVEARRSET